MAADFFVRKKLIVDKTLLMLVGAVFVTRKARVSDLLRFIAPEGKNDFGGNSGAALRVSR